MAALDPKQQHVQLVLGQVTAHVRYMCVYLTIDKYFLAAFLPAQRHASDLDSVEGRYFAVVSYCSPFQKPVSLRAPSLD